MSEDCAIIPRQNTESVFYAEGTQESGLKIIITIY